MAQPTLPRHFFDPHHHFYDPANNEFQSFLKKLGLETFTDEHYRADVVNDLRSINVRHVGSIHVEAVPDNGLSEVEWLESLISAGRCDTVTGIVASVNLADDNTGEQLKSIVDASSRARGIRWILDYAGPYSPCTGSATHVATTRVKPEGVDYLRGDMAANFERGFALLENHKLSFDVQCAPEQLLAAAGLFSKYPNVPVCIDHMGKVRMVLGDADFQNDNTIPDEAKLAVWRAGMKAMAKLPQVSVKISMLGYCVPGWNLKPEREVVLKGLVREVVNMFGVGRCMVASNWHTNAACSDSDGLTDVGPTPSELVSKVASWFGELSAESLDMLFANTAMDFYRIH